MHVETTVILMAEEGKILRNKESGITTPSVWLKIGERQEDWEEIDMPEEPQEEVIEEPDGEEQPK